MAANVEPVFGRVPRQTLAPGLAAALNTANLTTGTLGTDVLVAITAEATDGSIAHGVTMKARPGTNTAACVARFWVNNGSTIATAANSALLGELQIPATTTSTTAPLPEWYYSIERSLAPGYRILVTISAYSTGGFDVIGWSTDLSA